MMTTQTPLSDILLRLDYSQDITSLLSIEWHVSINKQATEQYTARG